jgi:hypothetical protein
MPSTTSNPIPLPYRLFHLYLEPVFALNGARLAIQTPQTYLQIISPPTYPHPAAPSPVETLLLAQIASLYALFAFNEAVILRYVGPQRLDIWRLIIMGCLIADVGHMWALWKVAGLTEGGLEIFWDPRMWTRWEEWGNLGLTWFAMLLRMGFVTGVGL